MHSSRPRPTRVHDLKQIREEFRDTVETLDGLPLTERTRELRSQAAECTRAIERQFELLPDDHETVMLIARVEALVAEITRAAERLQGPRSQPIRIS